MITSIPTVGVNPRTVNWQVFGISSSESVIVSVSNCTFSRRCVPLIEIKQYADVYPNRDAPKRITPNWANINALSVPEIPGI